MIHTGTNDLTNGVNTMKEIRKIIKCVRDLVKDKKVNIGFSSVISRSDRNLGQEIRYLNLKLKRYCKGNNFLFVDNVNIEESCLNNSKLHLNHKATNILCQNIKNSMYHYWCSVRNKFENFKEIINGNVDIFTIAETKLDGSFPTSQFELEGYYSPFRLDITKQSGGLLVYIKSSIPSRQLSYGSICNSIQAIPFEINLRQEKWLTILIYRPPSQDSGFFIHTLTEIIDHFATKYDNHLIMGDFNMEPNNRMFKDFLDSNNLTNLIKTNTCFKGKGSSIDLILTNRKYSFKYTSSYETGLSDHHHMVYTMLKSSFINIEPKLLNYGDYKNFNFGNFKEDLSEALILKLC